MAEQVKKVLLEVSMKEQDKVLADAAGLNKQIQELSKVQEQYVKILKEKGTLNEKERVELERTKSQIANLKKEYNEVQRVAAAYNQVQTREIGSYKQLNALIQIEETKLKNLAGTLSKAEDGTIILTDEYIQQSKAVDELNKARIKFDQGIQVGRTNVGNYANSILDARNRIEQLEDFINNSGVDMGSKEFKDAKDEADNLRLSVDQALGKVDEFGNREPKNPAKKAFDDAFESTVALSGAIGIVTSLMGDESETAVQLAKAMEAVAIAQAAANVLKAKGAILDTAQAIRTKVLTVGQYAYTTAVGTSTGAMRIFRIALAASGIGLLIVGLIAAADAMNLFGSSTEDAAEEQERLNQAIDDQNKKLTEQFNIQQKDRTKQIADTQNAIELKQAEGATEQEIHDLKIKLSDLEIRKAGVLSATLLKGTKEQIDAQLAYEKLLNDRKVLDADYTKSLADEYKKRKEEQRDIELENMELRIITQTEGMREELLLFNFNADKRIEAAKKKGLDMNLVELDIQQKRKDLIEKFNDEIELMLVDVGMKQVENTDGVLKGISAAYKKNQDDFNASSDARKEKLQEEFEFTQGIFIELGEAFASSIDETGLNLEKFAKSVTLLLLDIMEKTLISSIANTTANQISTFGFAGIFKAAILSGIITAGFESAKALINKPIQKLEQGGSVDVGGKRHSDGGTKFVGSDGTEFEAEAGEKIFVVNRGASDFLNKIGSVNNAFKNKAYYSRPNYLEDGGFVQRRISNNTLTSVEIERAMIAAVERMKQPKLVITELKENLDSMDRSIKMSEL